MNGAAFFSGFFFFFGLGENPFKTAVNHHRHRVLQTRISQPWEQVASAIYKSFQTLKREHEATCQPS